MSPTKGVSMTRVELRPGTGGRRWAKLRPITGEDEMGLDPAESGAGNVLLSRLLVDSGATVGPDLLPALTVTDRDRLLAGVYRKEFGDRIDGIAPCSRCGEQFEFSFSLNALVDHLTQGSGAAAEGPDGDGFYRLQDGIRFRLPTVRDVDEVGKLPVETAVGALLDRCVAEPLESQRRDAVQAAMEQVAPILNLDIESTCPHCAMVQGVAFNLETYLLRALAQERRFLTHEIHRLAFSYGWSLRDILCISREDRRNLVRRIEAESPSGAQG
jgi:hypothetical protein